MCGQLQSSITACIYFLSPHRVKKVDLIIMSALSQLVRGFFGLSRQDFGQWWCRGFDYILT